jgi:CBS domain-containing membrane protein
MKKGIEKQMVDIFRVVLTDADIIDAMKSIAGYIEITPGDFRELCCIAYKHAAERLARSMAARDIVNAILLQSGTCAWST